MKHAKNGLFLNTVRSMLLKRPFMICAQDGGDNFAMQAHHGLTSVPCRESSNTLLF